jgi:DNA polymerase-4
VTRVRSLPSWTDSDDTIYRTARELYAALDLDRPRIRLVGVKCENFRNAAGAPEQLTLETGDCGPAGRRPRADRVLDAARARFGAGAIRYGSD